MRIVFLGLSVTSSWGNGHATNYRGLMRALTGRGHDVLFLERDVPWYASERDMPDPPWGRTALYGSLDQLREEHSAAVAEADVVIVGSYVPDGVAVGDWVQETAAGVRAFYDIDTPVTLAKLERGDFEYLEPRQVPGYDLYLSFTGGPTLDRIEQELGSPRARAFYCMVDPDGYFPEEMPVRWELGYLGTYSDDRQPGLDALLLEPARRSRRLRAVVAGPKYPDAIEWPGNVERIEHLPPARHREFYRAQRLTVNVTRRDMARAGWSPSVRLFEAAACATPIVSDRWPGLEEIFPEVIVADGPRDVIAALARAPEELQALGLRSRERVLREHTGERRALELEEHVRDCSAVRA
jgi:spore maturation protein CgeB